VNSRYPLDDLLAAAAEHVELTGRRLTFEYVLLAGVNDREADAHRLARLANRVPCKINLIPYNPTGLDGFLRPTGDDVTRFAQVLYPRTYAVTVRQSQGKDIFAACGQLAQPAVPRPKRPRRREPAARDRVAPATGPLARPES
jgi:23S rRNA (adenine2503-C2)-methyltransferase